MAVINVNMQEILDAESGSGNAGDILARAGRAAEAAGSDFVVICSNGLHEYSPCVADAVSIPLIHIADSTAGAVLGCGIRRIGLMASKDTIIQGFDKDGSKKPVKSRLCGQQQAMRQLKLNKFTEQGYRFHQWYPFSVAPHGRHRYKNLWRFFVPIFGKEPDR